METEINICTKEHPYNLNKDKPGRWSHPEAKEIGEDYGKGGGVADGDYIIWNCPICNKTFYEELPN